MSWSQTWKKKKDKRRKRKAKSITGSANRNTKNHNNETTLLRPTIARGRYPSAVLSGIGSGATLFPSRSRLSIDILLLKPKVSHHERLKLYLCPLILFQLLAWESWCPPTLFRSLGLAQLGPNGLDLLRRHLGSPEIKCHPLSCQVRQRKQDTFPINIRMDSPHGFQIFTNSFQPAKSGQQRKKKKKERKK